MKDCKCQRCKQRSIKIFNKVKATFKKPATCPGCGAGNYVGGVWISCMNFIVWLFAPTLFYLCILLLSFWQGFLIWFVLIILVYAGALYLVPMSVAEDKGHTS